MTPWQWWWIEDGADEHGGWGGDCDTREDAIVKAQREVDAGEAFFVIEARSFEAMKYEGTDCVPFLRTRNKERFVNGPIARE